MRILFQSARPKDYSADEGPQKYHVLEMARGLVQKGTLKIIAYIQDGMLLGLASLKSS